MLRKLDTDCDGSECYLHPPLQQARLILEAPNSILIRSSWTQRPSGKWASNANTVGPKFVALGRGQTDSRNHPPSPSEGGELDLFELTPFAIAKPDTADSKGRPASPEIVFVSSRTVSITMISTATTT